MEFINILTLRVSKQVLSNVRYYKHFDTTCHWIKDLYN